MASLQNINAINDFKQKNITIYLDICCFNRPYDDQTQHRIQLEAAAKLMIQSFIVDRQIDYVWSYVLGFENAKNPFIEKQNTILAFKQYANKIIQPNKEIEKMAIRFQNNGFKAYDSLHIACAVFAQCDYFLTVDDGVLRKQLPEIKITDPVVFINKWLKQRSTQ